MIETLRTIEEDAERKGADHLILVEALLSASKSAMQGHKAFSRIGAVDLRSQMQNIAWDYIETMQTDAESILSQHERRAYERAVSDLGLDDTQERFDALGDAFAAITDTNLNYLQSEIITQSGRDVNQILKDYRNAALRALMIQDTKGLSRADANMSVLIDEMNTRRRPWFKDRAGRKIPSQKYIRKLWRQVLRDQGLQVYLATLTAHGRSEAQIWHPDPKHHAYGETLKITETDYGLENIETVFHPNARALPALFESKVELAA